MKRTGYLITALFIAALAVNSAAQGGESAAQAGSKVAVLVVSPAFPGNFVKLLKALSYSLQLKKAGVDTVLLFDGSGSALAAGLEEFPGSGGALVGKEDAWLKNAPKLTEDQEKELSKKYAEVKAAGVSVQISDIPAAILARKDGLAARKIMPAKTDAATGELDISQYVLAGYQVWVF